MGEDPALLISTRTLIIFLTVQNLHTLGQVLDNTGQPIRWEWRANKFADYRLPIN